MAVRLPKFEACEGNSRVERSALDLCIGFLRLGLIATLALCLMAMLEVAAVSP